MASGLCAVGLIYPQISGAGPAPETTVQTDVNREAAEILELTPDQQYYWVMGHVMGMSHMAGVHSVERGRCILDWYLEDPAGKAALILGSVKQYPQGAPGVIVMAYVNRACGIFDQ